MIKPLVPLETYKTFKPTVKNKNLKISKEARAALNDFHSDEVPDFKLNIISNKELSIGDHYIPCPGKKEVEKQKFDKIHLKLKHQRLLNDWRRNRFNLIHKIKVKESKQDPTKKLSRKNSPSVKRSKSRSKSRSISPSVMKSPNPKKYKVKECDRNFV